MNTQRATEWEPYDPIHRTDMSQLDAALWELNRAIARYGLASAGWRGIINYRAKARFGNCNHDRKTIELSEWHAAGSRWDRVLNTILHEVAHALCGHGEGHGPRWKRVARSIGCDASRAAGGDGYATPPTRYALVCKQGHDTPRSRKPKKGARYSCTKCWPYGFSADHLMTLVER